MLTLFDGNCVLLCLAWRLPKCTAMSCLGVYAPSVGMFQAILFRNQRSIGRLVTPSLFCSHTLYEAGNGSAVVAFSLDFELWLPASPGGAGGPGERLSLPVDTAFQAASHRIQVLGRTAAGLNFALPFSYTFSGQHICAALDYHAQRQSYVRRHQEVRGGAVRAADEEVSVLCGARCQSIAPVICKLSARAGLMGVEVQAAANRKARCACGALLQRACNKQ